jgi:threonine dehydratase
MHTLPTFADVESAAARLRGHAHRTPVLHSRTLNATTGASVYFKCENFQRAGAFKFRGAYNALSRLSTAQRTSGVLTYSSGNHAQAIALAGSLLGISTTIVMPSDAPGVKRAATEGYGGHVVTYDRETEDREVIGRAIAGPRGLTIIPPYDHFDIIAGQGTAARELFDEVGPLDVLVTPCGGGGLLSGSAISAHTLSPGCRVVGVEPQAGDDGVRSFASGSLQTVRNPQTIADGARTPSLGQLPFAVIRAHVSQMTTVDDEALVRAMRCLAERLKIVVEPTGALAAAAVLERLLPVSGLRVGVILSGGNVDVAQWGRWLADGLAPGTS